MNIEDRLRRVERRCRVLSCCLLVLVALVITAGAAAIPPRVLGTQVRPLKKIYVDELFATRIWTREASAISNKSKARVSMVPGAIALDSSTGERQLITFAGLRESAALAAAVRQGKAGGAVGIAGGLEALRNEIQEGNRQQQFQFNMERVHGRARVAD
jgi:hypothetical protein